MVEATKKLNTRIEEITNLLVGRMSAGSISEMSDTDLQLMRSTCAFVKEMEDVMMKQAIIIEAQGVKIDELLRIIKKMDQK